MTSKIKVDNITNQSDSNIVNKCGTTITLGASGDTINLASGASQTGFGRTGTVDWQTAIKTGDFTAVSGEGYFVNTTSGAITMTLPASPSVGAIVSIKDYAQTFDTYILTVGRNGSNFNGGSDFNPTFNTEGSFLTFIYADATKGWLVTDNSASTTGATNAYITATGGTITTVCTDYKVHTFTGPGTFTVNSGGGTIAVVDYMVVAGGGGGGGGSDGSGGGSGAGAGGFRTNYPSSCAGVPVSTIAYPIVVGGGGTGGFSASPQTNNCGTGGNTSSALGITSAGGGLGRHGPCSSQDGQPGGSGGGASGGGPGCRTGGSGNTPPVSPPQGNNGGDTATTPSTIYTSAGGGGAGGVGNPAQPGPRLGGVGVANSISSSPVTYAAGGNGGGYQGATIPISPEPANSGNGGDGKSTGPAGSPASVGANGGSGIVVIRYKFQ